MYLTLALHAGNENLEVYEYEQTTSQSMINKTVFEIIQSIFYYGSTV